jgi:hypothetical protein
MALAVSTPPEAAAAKAEALQTHSASNVPEIAAATLAGRVPL